MVLTPHLLLMMIAVVIMDEHVMLLHNVEVVMCDTVLSEAPPIKLEIPGTVSMLIMSLEAVVYVLIPVVMV